MNAPAPVMRAHAPPGGVPGRGRIEPTLVTQPFNPEPMYLDEVRRRPAKASRESARPAAAPAPRQRQAPGAADPAAASGQILNEVLMAGGALLAGLLVTPALFWLAAPRVIGPYTRGSDGRSLGVFTFLNDYFAQLGHGSQMAWVVALGPLLMLSFGRLVWMFLLRPKPQLEP